MDEKMNYQKTLAFTIPLEQRTPHYNELRPFSEEDIIEILKRFHCTQYYVHQAML